MLLSQAFAALAVATVAFVAADPFPALAQAYPQRVISLVNGYPPGGPADIPLRMLAKKMSESVGSSVIVENKPGAQSAIAAAYVARAANDGYTLLQCTTNTMLTMMLSKNARYSFEDFSYVSLMALNRYALSVPNFLSVNSLKEFVEYVKPRPDQLNFGHLGAGSSDEIMGRAFQKSAGLKLVGVPYPGQAPLAQALVTGQIHFAFGPIATVSQLQKSGQVKVLAVATETRLPEFGELPTMKEQGYDLDMGGGSWLGLCAPKNTPGPIVLKLNAEVRKAVASSDYQSLVNSIGSAPISSDSPQAFRSYMERFVKVWGDTLADLGYERR